MALLELRGVTKKLGGLVAANNFDMDINEVEIRALIGPRGASLDPSVDHPLYGTYCSEGCSDSVAFACGVE